MNAHDQVERQLRDAIRRRRRTRGRKVVLVALPAVLTAAAVAGATGVIGGSHPGRDAREVSRDAVESTANLPACGRRQGGGLVTGPVPPEVAKFLTGPTPPVPPFARKAIDASGAHAIEATVRGATLDNGQRVVMYVSLGDAFGALADPGACARARVDYVDRSSADPSVKRRARGMVSVSPDTQTDLKMLSLQVVRKRGSGGTGVPLRGRELRSGVYFSSSSQYGGLVRPSIAKVVALRVKTGREIARVTPRFGMFVIVLPRHTGPVRLHYLDAQGRVVSRERIRQ